MSAKRTSSSTAPRGAGSVRWGLGLLFLVTVGLTVSFLITDRPTVCAEEAAVAPPVPADPPPTPASSPAPASDEPAQPVPVDPNITQARVSYQGGAGMVKGKADSDWSYASVNAVVLPGDSLWVDREGSMEIETAQGTYLRLADGSKADVVALTPTVDIRGTAGSFFVQRLTNSSGDVTFETPVGNVRVAPGSDVRVDILGNGSTTVSARWGQAVVPAPDGGDVTVTQGQRSYIDPGYLPSLPVAFDKSAEDSFDTWNHERARLLMAGQEKLPDTAGIPPTTLGTADLGAYGDWVDYDGQQYWRPDVEGYVPYRDGYWDYVPDNGYCWVDDYPFAYTTCHYGRWIYDPDQYGWLWGWEPGWGLGWCATLACGPNFVWCPLDPWNRPCWGFGGGSFRFGGWQFGFGACSFCGIDDLRFGRCHVHPFDHGRYDRFRGDVGIFSINGHGGHFLNFHDPTLRVHNFPPDRFVRGRETLQGLHGGAAEHVASLEQGRHTPGLNAVTHAGMRTRNASNVRTAQISPAIMSHTREMAGQLTTQRSTTASRGFAASTLTPHQAISSGRLGGTAVRTRQSAPSINASHSSIASRPSVNSGSAYHQSIAPRPQRVYGQGTATHVRSPEVSSPSGRMPTTSRMTRESSGTMSGPPTFHSSQQRSQSVPAPSYSGHSFQSAPEPSSHSAPSHSEFGGSSHGGDSGFGHGGSSYSGGGSSFGGGGGGRGGGGHR